MDQQRHSVFLSIVLVLSDDRSFNQLLKRLSDIHTYVENHFQDYEYILATARLLPNYGFPVGLNVVDKFAKIPNWMSKASRKYYATHLLKQAIRSKDQNTISLAVKILSKKVRSWRNRPLGGLAR